MLRRFLLPAILLAAAAVTTAPWLVSSWKLVDWLDGQPRWRRRVAVDGEWTADLRALRSELPAGEPVHLVGDPGDVESRRILGATVFHLYPLVVRPFGPRARLEEVRESGEVPAGSFVEVMPGTPHHLRRLAPDDVAPWPRLVVPFAAELIGSRGIRYRTTLTLRAEERESTVLLRARGTGVASTPRRVVLAAGESRTVDDIFAASTGGTGLAALEMRAAQAVEATAELVATRGEEVVRLPLPVLRPGEWPDAGRWVRLHRLAGTREAGRWRLWGVNLGGEPAVVEASWTAGGRTERATLRLPSGGLAVLPDDALPGWPAEGDVELRLEGEPNTLVFASRRAPAALATEMSWGEPTGERP